MQTHKILIRNISLLFLVIFQNHTLAQSLATDQIKELQGLQTTPSPFEVFVLYDEEDNPTNIKVLMGVDYNIINNSEVKSLKRLMKTFPKVYIPTDDSVTMIGKELLKDHAKCCVVRDSNWLAATHLSSGLPTLMSGCGAAIGFIATCNSPTIPHMISTLLASYFTYKLYYMWKCQTAEERARDIAKALIDEDDSTVLAVVDKTSARFVMNILIKIGKYTRAHILHEEEDEKHGAPKRKRLKYAKQAEESYDQEDTPPQEQKSHAELDVEVEEKRALWEKERQARIEAEEKSLRADRIKREWKKREKIRN